MPAVAMMAGMPELKLFGRPDCHLCEVAAALLDEVLPGVPFEAVDIEIELSLIMRYGQRVPVLLRTDTQAELGWPFDAVALEEFLSTRE